jgi:hypothetical protein
VRDPDGYWVEFWAVIDRSMSEVLALYLQGRERLRETLDGLADSALDQRAPDGGWSIRQIVHHLADAELTVLAAIRVALASPGVEYVSHPYDQEEWAVALHYEARDTGPSLRLIESIRDEVTQLLDVVPNAWNRAVRTPLGGETSVEHFTSMLAIHTLEHIEQIVAIRDANAPDARINPPGARADAG